MEDAHAHPLSPVNTIHTRSRSSTTLTLRDHPSSNTTPKSVPHTRQQRILQTRNARFPAQRLSVNGITVPFPHLIRSVENDTYFSAPRLTKREENGLDPEKSSDLTSTSPRSSILNEITNSGAYRVRGVHRRAPIPVFQDSTENPCSTTAGPNSPSVYHDAASDIQSLSGVDSFRGSTTMGLREVSINLHRPSPNKDSPYNRSMRSSSRRVPSHSKARFNSEEYIEHIENELQLVKDAMYSPTTNMPWKEKLRKAKEENERLKKEIEIMRSSFEFELQQTVERSTETEQRLKRRIKDLEDEMEHKQTVIQDLEYDREEKSMAQGTLEVLKARIEKLEEEKSSLENTNRDMTKRNEVLTQLLALSPTKTHHNFELPTPRRRSARPMSMIIPKLPSSPGGQTPLSRPQSVLISPALPASDYFPASVASSPLASTSGGIAHSPSASEDAHSIDSGLGESASHFTEGAYSRRSTLASCISNSPQTASTGHRQPEARPPLMRQPSKRRPRKFMPGPTQLKPLLLPTFTSENGNLPSTSPLTSPNRNSVVLDGGLSTMQQWGSPPVLQRRTEDLIEKEALHSSHDVAAQTNHAFQSLEEVFAKEEGLHYPGSAAEESYESPDQRRCLQSPSRIQDIQASTSPYVQHEEDDAYASVGPWGLGIDYEMPTDVDLARATDVEQTNHSDLSSGHERNPGFGTGQTPEQLVRSLETLDEQVEIPRPLFFKDVISREGDVQSSPCTQFERSPWVPRKRRKPGSAFDASLPEDDLDPGGSPLKQSASPSSPESSSGPAQRAVAASAEPSTRSFAPRRQRSNRGRSPLEILQQRNVGPRPLAAITIQTVYATLSRYTSYIQSFKRDPLALARRVIANAWRSNWAVFGKLSWWVIGLFIGYRRPRLGQRTWDWDNYDGESIADRCCGSDENRVPVDVNSASMESGSVERAVDNVGVATSAGTTSTDGKSSPPKEPKPGWGKSLFLWGKFSVAIMLAVGGAIVKGPAEMLRETEERRRSRSNSLTGINAREQSGESGTTGHTGRAPDRFYRHQQGAWPATTPDREDIKGMATIRKVRSFSSPTPPSWQHQVEVEIPLHDQSCQDLSENEQSKLGSHGISTDDDDAPGAANDTLKPVRTERKAIGSLFELPGDECLQNPVTADSPDTGNAASTSGGRGTSIEHLLENG
ncbi:hypothetical protein ABEF95_006060 [Exophiala dermatitidis]